MPRRRKHRKSDVIPKPAFPPGGLEALSPKSAFSLAEALVWITLVILAVFSVVILYLPLVRAFYRFEFNYNEGWNAYNAQTAMQHLPLYYPKFGWTTVNYPCLSFYLVGYLSSLTGDYLITGRLLSIVALVVSCVLVGLIVKKLTGGRGAAVFAGVFCLGLFCARALSCVGADDPQILPFPFFLFGMWLYLGSPPSTLRIAAIASLFTLGGNIKQNLLAAPLSVLADLFTVSSSKAVRFLIFGVFFLALSIAANILVGGPYFVSHLLTSRAYSFEQLHTLFFAFYSPLGLPLAISAYWSVWQLRNPRTRMISFYFFSSLLIGMVVGGGSGVSQNTYFENLFAMSIIMGACLDFLWKAPIRALGKDGRWRFLTPVLLYSSVSLTFLPWGTNLPKLLSDLPELQRQYQAEVSFLVAQPGPAICESLILCYDAGKPYIFDPFNATRLVGLGKLNSQDIVKQIAEKKYGAIQTQAPVTQKRRERFPDDVYDAINRYYVAALKVTNCVIYVPRVETGGDSNRQ
jgi:hypothetical protein